MAELDSVVIAETLVLFAALVVVPLGAPLVLVRDRAGARDRVEEGIGRWAGLCGALLAGGFWFRGQPWAWVLAVPWLVATVVLAGAGARRLAGLSRRRLGEVAGCLGLVYLAVGGAWAFAYVAGLEVMGFSGVSALLTANHFHYAGFGANVLAAGLGRTQVGRGVPYRVATVGVMAGIALLALGITLSPPLERAAAWIVAGSTVVLGGLLAARGVGMRRWGPRVAAVLGGGVTLLSAALAVQFAMGGGFAGLSAPALATMVTWHGLVNALGFVGLGIVALRAEPAPLDSQPPGLPLSRLRAPGVTGATFFDRVGAVDPERRAVGLTDRFDDYVSPTLGAAHVAPAVRAFYEHTADTRLFVVPEWQPGFVLGGRVWRAFARVVGQLNLPWDPAAIVRPVNSRVVPLRDALDGRERVRGWVRTYRNADGTDGEPVYVAAYSSHVLDGRRYMNIAFPLPWSNMTSVLRIDALPRGGGVSLSTRARDEGARDGDQGVYLSTAIGHLRLPLDEVIDVWEAEAGWEATTPPPAGLDAGRVRVLAVHDMWVFGVRYLRLTYFIEVESS